MCFSPSRRFGNENWLGLAAAAQLRSLDSCVSQRSAGSRGGPPGRSPATPRTTLGKRRAWPLRSRRRASGRRCSRALTTWRTGRPRGPGGRKVHAPCGQRHRSREDGDVLGGVDCGPAKKRARRQMGTRTLSGNGASKGPPSRRSRDASSGPRHLRWAAREQEECAQRNDVPLHQRLALTHGRNRIAIAHPAPVSSRT